MSLYDRFRWSVLHTVAVYHMTVCASRMTAGAAPTKWVHDRPDWVIKYFAAYHGGASSPDFQRLKRQAMVELDFRRATGASK